jgi:polysaccharide export outer membrane protein
MRSFVVATSICCMLANLFDTAAQTKAATTPALPDVSPMARQPSVYSDYTIGAFDKIRITVFEMKELETVKRVSENGTITLPLLGEVAVGGLTPEEAETAIAKMLRDRKLLIDPQVSVSIEEYVSRRVFVTGAITKPGPIDMMGPKSLLDVIGEAGGPNNQAGKKIFVFRPFSKNEERLEVDAERLLYDADPLINAPLEPGDIIYVPYAQKIAIYVNGEVRNPSAVEFIRDEPVTVLRAITAAGGTTERANESRVKVHRQLDDGTKQSFTVNLKRIRRGKAEDMQLQRNDIVDVPASFF